MINVASAGRPVPAGGARQFAHYFVGTVLRPRATFDALKREASVRWAVVLAGLLVIEVWLHMLLHAALGMDYLGPRPILADPTFVGFFGHLRIARADWLPVFAAFMPLVALFDLVLTPGIAHLMSKLWHGHGTFEQTINGVVYAALVPAFVIGVSSEWLFTIPMNVISGHAYWWTAAMAGEFGPTVAAIWNFYVIGIYSIAPVLWSIGLGALALRRIQDIPVWAAAVTMLVAYMVTFLVGSVFVR